MAQGRRVISAFPLGEFVAVGVLSSGFPEGGPPGGSVVVIRLVPV